MSMNTYTQGPGDSITWGACAGHPHDPRTPEPTGDTLTPEDAADRARDMLASSPALVSEWLEQQCAAVAADLDTYATGLALRDTSRPLSVPELLCLLMDGYEADLPLVRQMLRDRFDAAHSEDADAMAAAILSAQDREQRELALWGDECGFTQ